jgi:hypothetical protein
MTLLVIPLNHISQFWESRIQIWLTSWESKSLHVLNYWTMFHVFCTHAHRHFIRNLNTISFFMPSSLLLFFAAPHALISSLLGSFCITARGWLDKDQQQHSTSSQKSPCCVLEWLMTFIIVLHVACMMTSYKNCLLSMTHTWHSVL